MKFPHLFLAPSLLAATIFTEAQAQVTSQPNPLDFPGQGPIGPTPGGPGGVPLIPQLQPVIIAPPDIYNTNINPSQTGPFVWSGGSTGLFFNSNAWRNSSFAPPSNFTTGTALNYALSATSVQFSVPATTTQIHLGTGSLTLTGSIVNLGFPPRGGILGNASAAPSPVNLENSTLIANYLRETEIESTGSLVHLFASRSEHQAGTPFTGSTIDLTGGSFLLTYSDATSVNPVTTQEVLTAYFGSISVGGFGPVLGIDPHVAEPGDNLLMLPITSSSDGGISSFNSGWGFSPVPEPSSFLLALAALPLAFRRHRTSNL